MRYVSEESRVFYISNEEAQLGAIAVHVAGNVGLEALRIESLLSVTDLTGPQRLRLLPQFLLPGLAEQNDTCWGTRGHREKLSEEPLRIEELRTTIRSMMWADRYVSAGYEAQLDSAIESLSASRAILQERDGRVEELNRSRPEGFDNPAREEWLKGISEAQASREEARRAHELEKAKYDWLLRQVWCAWRNFSSNSSEVFALEKPPEVVPSVSVPDQRHLWLPRFGVQDRLARGLRALEVPVACSPLDKLTLGELVESARRIHLARVFVPSAILFGSAVQATQEILNGQVAVALEAAVGGSVCAVIISAASAACAIANTLSREADGMAGGESCEQGAKPQLENRELTTEAPDQPEPDNA